MKSIWTKAALTAALVGAQGLAALAQTPAPQAGTPGEQRTERMGRRGHMGRLKGEHGFGRRALGSLNLTDAQRQQMRAIRERYQQSFQPQRQELRQLAEIRRGGGGWTPEQSARAQELHAQLRANGEKLRTELQGVLTPEQQQQLKQEREQFRQHREEFRERMKERRGRRLGTPPAATPTPDN